jgi:hypothetical protein
MQKLTTVGLAAAALAGAVPATWLAVDALTGAPAGVQRVKFVSDDAYLMLEFLDDDLLHFEMSGVGEGPEDSEPVFTTPQVAKTDYPGPKSFAQDGNTLDTAELTVVVDESTLCMTLTDKLRKLELTTVCPSDLGRPSQRLSVRTGRAIRRPWPAQRQLDRAAADTWRRLRKQDDGLQRGQNRQRAGPGALRDGSRRQELRPVLGPYLQTDLGFHR